MKNFNGNNTHGFQNQFDNNSTFVQLTGEPFVRYTIQVKNVEIFNNQVSIDGVDEDGNTGRLSVNLTQKFERNIFNGAILNALRLKSAGAPFDLKNMVDNWFQFTYQEQPSYNHTYLNLRDIELLVADESDEPDDQVADKAEADVEDVTDDQA
ncbi:hypothetical protein [Secundilactobacillus muriivasis]